MNGRVSIYWVIRDLEIQKRRKAESEKKEREDRLKERERKKFYEHLDWHLLLL